MRKSGKLLLGVLSVAALIGTGMGAFIINGTYGSDTDTIGVTTTEEYYSRGFNITAEKAADDGINFDGTGGDLSVTYTVKATAIDGGFTQDALYNPETWNAVAKEHRPNLKISATHTNVDETRAAAFNKYVVLPDVATISYETWLAANLKETGYTYEFKVEWNKEALGGHSTPNEYFATVDNATGKEVYNDIKSALQYAKITVTFEAGYYEGGSTVDPTPDPVETTGAVTLPDATSNAELAISGTQENGTIEAGEQTLSLTLEDGYDLEALNVSVDGAAAEEVAMKEVQSNVLSLANPGKKYEGTYTFEKDKTYEFSVVTKASTPDEPEKYAKVNTDSVDNLAFNVTTAGTDDGYAVGTKVEFTATPTDGYRVSAVTVNDGNDTTTLTAVDGVYSFTVDAEGTYTISGSVYMSLKYVNDQVIALGSSASTNYDTVTTRGYVTGYTLPTSYNNHSSVFIADGTTAVTLYRVGTSYLTDVNVGDLVEITGTAYSHYGYPEVKDVSSLTKVTDAQVESAATYSLNKDNEADFDFDLTNGLSRKYSIADATVVRVASASSGNGRNITFYVGTNSAKTYTLYAYNADDEDFDTLAALEAGDTFTCDAFVGLNFSKGRFVAPRNLNVVKAPKAYATVTAATIEHGTVTITDAVEGNQYEVGSTVTWTVSPEQGYEVESYWYTVGGGEQQTVTSGSLEITEADATYVVGANMKQSSSTEEPGGDTPAEESLNSVSFASSDLTATSSYEYKNIDYTDGEHAFNMKLSCGNKGSLNKINKLILLGANDNGTTTTKFNAEQIAEDGSVAFANTQYLTSEILADLGETDADTAVANKPITVLDLSIPSSFGKVKDFAFTVAAIDSNVSKGYFVETVINEQGEKEFNYLGSVTPAIGDLTYTYTESKNISSIALVTVSSDAFGNATRTGFSNFAINTASVA